MAKYRRTIQSGGFRPEQVSEKNITRLQEHADRITQALRDERNAVISDRNNIAQSMKENAAIEQKQSETSYRIQKQNEETLLQQERALAARAEKQFEMDSRASAQVFGDLSRLSFTAADKLREIEIEKLTQKDKALAAEIMLLGDNHPHVKALAGLKTEVQIEEIQSKSKLAQAREAGLDDYEADKILKNLNKLGYHSKSAILNHVSKKWGGFLRDALQDSTKKYYDPETNEMFSGMEAGRDRNRAQIVASQELKVFEDIHGTTAQLASLKQETGFYNNIFSVTQTFVDSAAKAHHADVIEGQTTDFRFKLRNAKDAKQAQDIIEGEADTLRSLLGNEGFQKLLRETAKQVDSDGNPMYNLAAMAAARIGPKGEAWGDRWKDQVETVKAELAQGQNAIFRQQEATKDREATQAFERIMPRLMEQLDANPAQDDKDILATAEAELLNKYGRVPHQFVMLKRQIENENKVESEQKAAIIREKIRTGRATQGEVLSIGNPTLRAELQQEYNQAVKARNFGPNYDATLKAVKKAAMKVMGDSLEGAASFQTERLNLVMQQDFAADYKDGLVKFNGDATRALDYASNKLEAEVTRALAGDQKARYYNTSGEYNQKVFNNIQALKTKTAAQKDEAMNTLISTIGAVGINALESPGLLGNEIELRHISQSNATGQVLQFTPQITRAANLLGITELEATNAAIAAHNKVNPNKILPLTLDPALQAVNSARPETRALFFNNPTTGSVYRGSVEIDSPSLSQARHVRSSMRPFVSGNTGRSTGPHGDFRVWDKTTKQYVNPGPFMNLLTVNGKPVTSQYQMTSPYGMRNHPVTGEYKMHHGIDYAMPEGTQVDVNARFLEEIDDPTAGIMGIYEFERNGRQYELHALHGQRRPRN